MKEMLRKLCNGDRPQWQAQLPQALAAYRNAVSTVTGYPPFFLYYGRRARLPLSTVLPDTLPPANLLGNRLSDMADVFKQAKLNTENSRLHNRARLARKATAEDIEVGDSVIVAANEPVSLSAKWDPQYEVTKVHGTTYWVRHQRTQKEIKVHRDKLRLVDPNMSWDEVAPRPRRQQRRAPNAPLPRLDPEPDPPPDAGTWERPMGVQNRPATPRPATPPGVLPRADTPIHQLPLPPTRPPGGSTPTPEPMDADPPHPYFLRKRPAPSISPCPEQAKRLRIDCLSFTHSWLAALSSTPVDHATTRPPSDSPVTTTPAGHVYEGDRPRRTLAGLAQCVVTRSNSR
jgi:hypothetical protein